MIQVGIFGSDSIYVTEMVQNLSSVCRITLVSRKVTEKSFEGDYELVSLPKIPSGKMFLFPFSACSKIKKLNKYVDVYAVHYLDIVWATLISLNILKKPMVYFVYGSDVNNNFGKFHTHLLKKSLQKFDLIFVEVPSNKQLLIEKYGVDPKKITPEPLWWNLNPCFKRNASDVAKRELRNKWNITKKYVIFSPRTCKTIYQHDILIKAVGELNSELRDNIEIVVTKTSNADDVEECIEYLNQTASDADVTLNVISKRLSSNEMAEVYNISHINVNIPNNDFFGRSIMEGAVCGSVPLLNEEIESYHEHMVHGKNCIMTKPTVNDVALSVAEILQNYDSYNEIFFKENFGLFSKYQEVEKTVTSLVSIMTNIAGK